MKCENCGCSNPKGCAECCECGAKMGAKAAKTPARKKASAKQKSGRIAVRRGSNGARASAR